MKSLYAIFIKEIKIDFFSLKSWVIVFFFLILMGLFFYSFIDSYISLQQAASKLNKPYPSLSNLISSYFGVIHFILILIVPAMTMGTFASEKQNNGIKLMMSSSVEAWQIVLGKFSALILYSVIILCLSFIFPWFLFMYGSPDSGIVLGSYVGLFLLISSYTSFGIWVSSLANNQLNAFILSSLGIFILMLIDTLSNSIRGHGFVKQTMKYISTTQHLEPLLQGVVTISDLTYFFLFTSLFLFLSCLSYESYKWK